MAGNEIFNSILKSDYGIFTPDGFIKSVVGLEIDRVVNKEGSNLILYLRVRNASGSPVKIFSFNVAEFIVPEFLEWGKVLENGWLQCSGILYTSADKPSKKTNLFLQRDQNPFSFNTDYGYIPGSVVSEWFTDIKLKELSLFIGAVTTADQFSQIYIKKEGQDLRLRITCQFDGLTLMPGQVVSSEKILFALGKSNAVKKEFAKSLALHMQVKEVNEPVRGMCNSYYWHGNVINDSIINRELEAIENLPRYLDLDYFQIDAGYSKYFGDYLDYKERFPNGFRDLINRIKRLGYKPGIWISPFAINPASKLHDYHPDWFLKGTDHGHFDGRLTSPFDSILDSVDLEVIDPTKSEVQEYLTKILIHFKGLGFKFFKTDFTYPIALSGTFSKKVTRAQALRTGLKLIRNVLGDEIPILTCISQLSPVVGIADFVRTGIDSLNPFVCAIPGINKLINNYMLENNLSESEERAFLNGIVWRADPDMLIFRDNTGIDEKIIENHREFAKENKMCLWIGDSIAGMTEVQKRKMLEFINNA